MKKLAVVGVSENPDKYGYKVFKNVLERGFAAFGVNPKGGEIFGEKIYPSLDELPETPDMVITVVPPEVTEKIIGQCAKLGIKEVWMQPGSESAEAAGMAEKHGIKTYSACFMMAGE